MRKRELLEIVEEREKTDLRQWKHHVSAFILIVIAFTVQLLRGTEKVPSVVGISNCSAIAHLIVGSFCGYAVSLIVFEVRRVRSE